MDSVSILGNGAYLLNRPPKDGEVYTDRKNRELLFNAWFEPRFRFDKDEYLNLQLVKDHADIPPKEYIQIIKEDIRQNGLLNPVMVTRKGSVWHLHPGKCRVAALTELGLCQVPAIIVDWTKTTKIPDNCYQIQTAEQFQSHFTGDIAPEFDYRRIRTPKIR